MTEQYIKNEAGLPIRQWPNRNKAPRENPDERIRRLVQAARRMDELVCDEINSNPTSTYQRRKETLIAAIRNRNKWEMPPSYTDDGWY